MSRIYVKPESEIVELEAEVLMSVTSGELDNVGTGNGNTDDNNPT